MIFSEFIDFMKSRELVLKNIKSFSFFAKNIMYCEAEINVFKKKERETDIKLEVC